MQGIEDDASGIYWVEAGVLVNILQCTEQLHRAKN